MRRLQYCFALTLLQGAAVESFQPIRRSHHKIISSRRTTRTALRASSDGGEAELKAKLSEYLKKRDEAGADDAAKEEVGKVIGGTRGNVVLDFVSGAPNKQRINDEVPNAFDYDELEKYGYGNLVTPIMQNGGRRAAYELMGLPVPAAPERLTKKKTAPKLVIDRTGETDDARYTGLKMAGLDDDAMGKALEEANRKVREGESLRKRLVEEDYVIPYADNPNVGPKQTPLWTPEKLDEAGKKAGEAQAWARKARLGELKKDPYEALAVEGELRVYSVFVAITVAAAYGNATPTALKMIGVGDSGVGLFDFFQIPALALLVAGVGSAVVNSVVIAPTKKRSSFVWGLKGLMGGPLAVRQLQELDNLQTLGEIEAQ